jgi:hypothetical protein
VAAPVQRTPGRRPLPVAVDTHRLGQCRRRTPAVQTPTFWTPTFWTPTAVPGAAADSQGVRGVRFRSHPDTGRGVRLGQDGGGPAAAVAARRQDRAGRICLSALVKLPGRRSQPRTAVRMRGHRTRPGEHREPARPALRTSATAAGHRDTAAAATLDSRQQDRSPPRNGVRPERDPNVWHRQHVRLTARSVAWCSVSVWSAPDRSSLLTLDASSVQRDPDGSRRIVWMIKEMIKQGSHLRLPRG